MLQWIAAWLAAGVGPFFAGLLSGFVKQWLWQQSVATAGAQAQRAAQEAADAKTAAAAKEMADEIRALPDDDFAARMRGW